MVGHTCRSCEGRGELPRCERIAITNPLTGAVVELDLELEALEARGARVVVEDEEHVLHHLTGLPWTRRRWVLDLRPCMLAALSSLGISPVTSVAVTERGVVEWGWLLRQITIASSALGEGLEDEPLPQQLRAEVHRVLAESFAGEGGERGVLAITTRPAGSLTELVEDLRAAVGGAGYGLGLGMAESLEGELGPQVLLVSQAEDPREISVVAELASGQEWRPVLVTGWDRLPATLEQLRAQGE